jgi:hypothetical protein
MTERTLRPGEQHPENYREDLNPDASAGQNYGRRGEEHEFDAKTAYDYKDLHRSLGDISDDQLKQIPVVPAGARLQQGATYIDLAGAGSEFTATGDMEAGRDNCYVPKDEVAYELWNRLRQR